MRKSWERRWETFWRSRLPKVESQAQPSARHGVATARVSGLFEQLRGDFRAAAVGQRIRRRPGHLRRHGTVRSHGPSTVVGLPTRGVEGGVEGLAEIAVGSKDWVVHVDPDVGEDRISNAVLLGEVADGDGQVNVQGLREAAGQDKQNHFHDQSASFCDVEAVRT